MNITYKYLNDFTIEQIHECFLESFKDYALDMSYMTKEIMEKRTRLGRVKFDYSVGAFDGEKMVGFLLVAIDNYYGTKMAFDSGTGIIKEYRGKGVAGSMFDYILPKIKDDGINVFILEVLQENEAAIKAYKKKGFNIKRPLDCYSLDLNNFKAGVYSIDQVEIKPIKKDELCDYFHWVDYELCWEHNMDAILASDDNIIIDGAFEQNECVGFIVYLPKFDWIFAVASKPEIRDEKVEKLLVTQLIEKVELTKPELQFDNIPPGNRMGKLIESMGFKIFTKQYEMIAEI